MPFLIAVLIIVLITALLFSILFFINRSLQKRQQNVEQSSPEPVDHEDTLPTTIPVVVEDGEGSFHTVELDTLQIITDGMKGRDSQYEFKDNVQSVKFPDGTSSHRVTENGYIVIDTQSKRIVYEETA